MIISIESPESPDVLALLAEHLGEMHATSPKESVHALDATALSGVEMTFWTARDAGVLLGCGALKELSSQAAEIKSMRTSAAARNRGVGAAVLQTLLAEAKRRGYQNVFLETGSQEHFAPARRLYQRAGFVDCGPFGDYRTDRHSVFMVRSLADQE
ncbi:GNAT family N-acetyltransferase [Psychromicrobium lacuslunae]|uniref:N-acetyltransferase domain-containing protein n=1 Tax=Psychromicrobium lacuslunae TaxID=1618207 RepID=A0A0D4BYG9_9MICC|nr:GNAT family N-acetyltransferase [Psychromicrobium lacuslunae]AJT41369.1 hypothetical protein UM93_07305 [Psychromicrobium lacuslunae]